MPTNFVKATDTPNPEIAVNQLSYDTGLQDLAEGLGTGLEALTKMREEREKAKALAGFEEAVFGLEEEKAIADADVIYKSTKARQDFNVEYESATDKTAKELAQKKFNDTISAIQDAAAQTGADYNYRIVAEVRRFSAQHPTLAGEFRQVLSFNKELQDLREGGLSVGNAANKAYFDARNAAEARQQTLSEFNEQQDILRKSEVLSAEVNTMVQRGKVTESMWKPFMTYDTELSIQYDTIDISNIYRQVATGRMTASDGRAAIMQMHSKAKSKLYASQDMIHRASEAGAFSQEGPIRIDIEQQEKMIEGTYTDAVQMLNNEDYRLMVESQARNDELKSYRFLSMFYTGDPNNDSLARILGPRAAIEAFDNMTTGLTFLAGTASPTEIQQAALGGGTADTRKALEAYRMRVLLAEVGGAEWPPKEFISGTPEQKEMLVQFGKLLLRRDPMSAVLAAKVTPLLKHTLVQMGNNAVEGKGSFTAEQIAQAEVALSGMEMEPDTLSNKAWSKDDVRNSESITYKNPVLKDKGVVLAALEPERMKIEGYITKYTSPEHRAHMKFSPATGWTYTPYTIKGSRMQGGNLDTSMLASDSKATAWLKNYHTYMVNTVGKTEADAQAQDIYEKYIATAEDLATPPVTSNAPAPSRTEVEITDEEMQRVLQGEDPSVILKEQAARGR